MGRPAAPLVALIFFCMAMNSGAAAAPAGVSASHPPVPRFVSLKTEGANGRRGPGADQPVEWVYQREGLPLLITGESGPWRRVRDPDGAEVWMRAQNLDDHRTALVLGNHDVALRREADSSSRVVAFLAPGVVGALTGCDGEWRRIAVGGRVGWLSKDAIWGADPTCPAPSSG